MSKISLTLLRLAAARRVSMEAADQAMQGQEGDLNEKELDEVAAKAADEVKPVDGETATETPVAAADETTDDATAAAGAEESAAASDEPADTGEVVADVNADAFADGAAGAAEAAANASETQTDEQAVAEIETPAEAEIAADAVDDQSTLDAAPAEAGAEEAALTDAVVEGSGNEGAAEVVADLTDASAEPVIDADAPAADAEVSDTATSADTDTNAVATDAVESTDAQTVDTTEAPIDSDAQTEAPAPAVAPGPKTDASEAVQEVVELTEAIAEAGSAEEVVKQARDMADDLTEVADTAEVINATGGASMESLAMMQLALRPHLNMLQRGDLNLGVSLESFAGQSITSRMQVSVEEIREVIAELEVAQPQLERQAIESLDRVVAALNDALPSACDRLKAVISNAGASNNDREGGNVQIDDGLSAALQVNGAMPEDMANELQTYAAFGKCLIGNYSDHAFRSAKAASMITNAVDFTSISAFWEKIGVVVDSATDPRCTLTRTQLESCLPGGVTLFSEAGPELDVNNPVIKKLIEFNSCYAPLEAMVSSKSDVGTSTYPAMSASKIVLVGKALLDVLCCELITARLVEGKKLWPEAQDSIRHLRENLAQAPREIEFDNGADFTQIVKFVETHYALATWPLVNYLTNLVLTVNAFVLFAERSLKAEETVEELSPATTEEVATDVVEDDTVVDEDLTVSSEGVISGAAWSFIFGPFATAILGAKAQNRRNELKALRDKIEAKQAELVAKEGQLVQLVIKASKETKDPKKQVSQEGFTGALKGGLLGLIACIVPFGGPAIVGGIYGSEIEQLYRDIDGEKQTLKALEATLAAKEAQVIALIKETQQEAAVSTEGFNDTFKQDGLFVGATVGGVSTGLAAMGFTAAAMVALLGGPAGFSLVALGALGVPSVVGAYIGHRKQELERELKLAKEKLAIKQDGLKQLKVQAAAMGVSDISMESLNVSMEGATGILKGLLGGITGPIYGAYAGHGIEQILQQLDGVGLQIKAIEEETEAVLRQITKFAEEKQQKQK